MKIEYNDVGYSQITINPNCEFEDFYVFADKLASLLNITYINKLDDFDTLYWDFNFEDAELVLCYNIYLGIDICPRKFKNASESDYQKLTAVYEILKSHNIQ